jgi:hypothetical protein
MYSAAATAMIADVCEYLPYLSLSTTYHLLSFVVDILDAGAGFTGGHKTPVDKMYKLVYWDCDPVLGLDKYIDLKGLDAIVWSKH